MKAEGSGKSIKYLNKEMSSVCVGILSSCFQIIVIILPPLLLLLNTTNVNNNNLTEFFD